MADKQKVLICGDVNGKVKTLFTRVENINKKNGPFDFLLCVGNFFGSSSKEWKQYQVGRLSAPVPTYVLGPNDEQHVSMYQCSNGDELASNINYLGKRGLFTTSSGLKICYVSGVEGTSPGDCTFTAADVTKVRESCVRGQPSYRGVDILLTSAWPSGVTRLDPKAMDRPPPGSPLLAWLAVHAQPRYHFCGLEGIYYERPPYKNLDTGCDSGAHCTRFMALAPVGNVKKQKWLFALSLMPIDLMRVSELRQQTTDQTDLPYTGIALSYSCTGVAEQHQRSQFFYDMPSDKRQNQEDEAPFKRKKQRGPALNQEQCWFCLASSKVEKHLVVSVGDNVYLALAKGGLVPQHVLIIPVTHHFSTTSIPDSVASEIEQFKTALRKFFARSNKVPVFFERNYSAPHLQIQVVPVPQDCADSLKSSFEELAESEGFSLDELPTFTKLEQIAPPGTPYFHVELPSGQKLFHRIHKNFPLNFGREVLACPYVLNMPEKSDWRECTLSKEKEAELCQKFREQFKPFDFTLE